jgi:hypothetical protein
MKTFLGYGGDDSEESRINLSAACHSLVTVVPIEPARLQSFVGALPSDLQAK